MVRVKKGIVSHRRHKSMLDNVKGYYSSRSRNFKVAKQSFIKSGQYAYYHRKLKKRDYRRLWIIRINSILNNHHISYSKFINLLKINLIIINRKMLAYFAIHNNDILISLIKLLFIC